VDDEKRERVRLAQELIELVWEAHEPLTNCDRNAKKTR
jgi:hypothetical protein